jgi:hypothetical protein
MTRLHKPTPEERSRLNIPDYIERLNLHDSKMFMFGCGFSKGTIVCSSTRMLPGRG